MQRIVVRVDLDPAAADAVQRALGVVIDDLVVKLGQDPPVHTRRALEAQREHLDGARRAVQLGISNPVEIDHRGTPVEL